MTEINNYQNFGIKKVETKKVNNEVMPEKQVADVEEKSFVQDTGVLGRSQVDYKGGNPTESVNRGIEIAELFEKYPEYAMAAELFEEKAIELLKKDGKSDADAEELAGIMTAKFIEENLLV